MSQASVVSQLLNPGFEIKKKKISYCKCLKWNHWFLNAVYPPKKDFTLVIWAPPVSKLSSQMRGVHMQVFTNTKPPKINQWILKCHTGMNVKTALVNTVFYPWFFSFTCMFCIFWQLKMEATDFLFLKLQTLLNLYNRGNEWQFGDS